MGSPMISVFIIMSFFIGSIHAWPYIALVPTYVLINNAIPEAPQLTVHCRSGDDDLGYHVLSLTDSYDFHFKPNFWGRTLFYCQFNWLNESRYFDIYIQKRDYSRCSALCIWWIKSEGPCYGVDPATCVPYPWN
ncbi:hypothetical protein MLD38_037813 [Melastoma candidum]|uniref:Uncharacterized protein n=1 Tax=Melastoma candidum TaxID=119954 RepID=A0ACB9LPC5_9MYRT|nr:hypothetical protein MLD38_040871 [Melastoma candidum]KAI4313034.1 hypothetical protein MLD38_037813 [Melastoma candidum]